MENLNRRLYSISLILGIIVACIVIYQFIAPRLQTPSVKPGPSPSGGMCPIDANNAASLYGGDPSSWKELSTGEWFYQNASQPLKNDTFQNSIRVDWWDNYNNHSAGPGDVYVTYASQLTLYCTSS